MGAEPHGDDPEEATLEVGDALVEQLSTSVMPGTAASGSTWSM